MLESGANTRGVSANSQQRQFLTIMFTDLSDSTFISAQMEPEHYSALLDRMRKSFVTIIQKHGGDIVRIDGDGFIFIFGYPEPYEDAARRALEAAIDIHMAMDDINQDPRAKAVHLQVHTGIHSGIILLKSGDMVKGRYEILGDPTNIAARLCDFAGAGEIVISEKTLGRTRSLFHISQQKSVLLKGQKEKLVVSKVSGRRATGSSQIESSTQTLIGRQKELIWLSEFISGKDSLALIQAEAGMGKSRLLHEFSNLMAQKGYGVHLGACEAYLGTQIFQPIEQISNSIIRSEFGFSNTHSNRNPGETPDVIRKISRHFSANPSDKNKYKGQEENLGDLFLELMNVLSGRPTIIIIDDWQWIDTASKKSIEALIKDPCKSIKIILASRNADRVFLEMNEAKLLALSALQADDVAIAVKELLPTVEPFILQQIQDYSGGNPLYLEELCHGAKNSRLTLQKNKSGSWLNSLICSRFARLPGDLADIVKIGAVIGHTIPEWLLNEVSGSPLDAQTRSALRESDFLYPGDQLGKIRFKHGITRDVIYDMVGLSERQRLHQKVVQELRKKAADAGEFYPHDQLAYHYAQGGNAKASVHHSQIAGENALQASALDKAQAHYKNALVQSENCALDDQEKVKLLRKFGLACAVDPSWDHLPVLEKAARNADISGDPAAIAWTEYWLGFNLYGLGLPSRSLRHIQKAFDHSETLGDDILSTQIIACLGQVYAAACQYEMAYKFLDTAIEVKGNKRSGTRASIGLAYALSCKGFALGDQGRFRDAFDCFDKIEDIMGDVDHEAKTSILNHQSAVHLWQGNLEECVRLTAQSMEMCRQMRARYNYAMAVFMNAAARFYQSGDDGAVAKMIEATDWLLQDRTGQNLSINFGFLADAFAQKKQWQNARTYAAKGIKRARLGDRTCEGLAYRALALAAKNGQTSKEPTNYIRKAYQSAEDRTSTREIENTQHFENLFFGQAHELEQKSRFDKFYIHQANAIA